MKDVFLTLLILVNLDRAELTVEHPQLNIKAPVIIGKPSTPTPVGVYLVKRGYSKQLGMRLLIFRREDNTVWAIHPNLPGRKAALESSDIGDNRLSGGCIGVSDKYFDLLWQNKTSIVLQVY